MTFLTDTDYENMGIASEIINPASFNLSVKTVRRCKREWEEITSQIQSYEYWKELGYPDVLDLDNRSIFFEEEVEIEHNSPVILLPTQSALFSTNELVTIKNGQVAFLLMRSGPARGKIEHAHAGLFDPGFGDPQPRTAVLEISNVGPWPIMIRRDQQVCQMIIFTGPKSAKPYDGKFANQTGAEPPRGIG